MATQTQRYSFGPIATDFSNRAIGTFADFDGSLGTLNSITLTFSFGFTSTITATNNGSSSGTDTAATVVVPTLDDTDPSLRAAFASLAGQAVTSSAYQTMIAAGSTGTGSTSASPNPVSYVETTASDLSAFTGSGSFAVEISTSTSVQNSNSSFSATTVATASGSVKITYNYTPQVVPSSPISISGTQTNQTTTSEAAIRPFAKVTIGDTTPGAIETLTINVAGAGGTLSTSAASGANGVTYSVSNGVYTLSGGAAQVTTLLDSFSFTPTAGQPSTQTTTIFTLSDKNANSATATDSLTMVSDIDPAVAPTIVHTSATTTLATASEAPVTPFAGVTIGDANGNGATDTLTIAVGGNGGTLSGAGVATNGVYTLAGTAAQINAQLDTLSFTPNAGQPSTNASSPFTLSDQSTAFLMPATDSAITVVDTDPAVAPTITRTYPLTTLATFTGTANGANPYAALIADSAGNLYGTTAYGGAANDGTVFEIVKTTGTLQTLASFTGAPDGANPVGLIADSAGNLYGTTAYGGASDDGTLFELAKGTSTLQTLASFTGAANGANPISNLVADSAGNLYGTTDGGGASNGGAVFEIVNGTLQTLVIFQGTALQQVGSTSLTGSVERRQIGSTGPAGDQGPRQGVIIDSAGNLDGAGAYEGLFVYSGQVAIENLTIQDAVARGGNGGSNAGGGAGLGGGLFVANDAAGGASPGEVTLTNVTFTGNSAVGGAGGNGSTVGIGGALNGGSSSLSAAGIVGFGNGGSAGSVCGAGGNGGVGGFGGGGGGAPTGGSYGSPYGNYGGGGFGGGGGYHYGGNGGLGAGADVFVQQGASLTIVGGTAGVGTIAGGNSGAAYGSGIFLQGNEQITLAPALGQTTTIVGVIADMTGSHDASRQTGAGSLLLNGAGTVDLTAANTFTGGIALASGTLELGNATAAGSAGVAYQAGGTATLDIDAAALTANTYAGAISGLALGDTIDLAGLSPTGVNAALSGTSLTIGADTLSHFALAAGLTFGSNAMFSIGSDGNGGTAATLVGDTGPTIVPATTSTIEATQTEVIGTVSPGFPGLAVTLHQTAGSGTVTLGPVQNGTYQVLYTAPSSVGSSVVDKVGYTVTNTQTTVSTVAAMVSVQLDAGATIAAAMPSTVEKGQTTVVGTVTPGLAIDMTTLKQAAGALGTLSLGAVVGGVQQVIYTAPTTMAKSAVDAVSYTVTDQHNDVVAAGSTNVQLDAGATIVASVPPKLGHGKTVTIGTATPGLATDTLSLAKITGSGTLVLVNGAVQYTATQQRHGGPVRSCQLSDPGSEQGCNRERDGDDRARSGPEHGNARACRGSRPNAEPDGRHPGARQTGPSR